ncbi:MAG: CCA tRNA nucleotidyltransferase [Simkaniaceae bacterium]
MEKDKHYKIGKEIVRKLQENHFTAYFAGGWVRDFLMKKPSDDIDIATDATPELVQQIFSKTIPVGIAFGIIIVVEDDHQFEIATFRRDKGYEDGRRPIGIELADPKEDALRRDFTINGMFYDPIKEKIFDFVGGKEDLQKGIIRAIGNPEERFMEDRLRMIRAVRYSSRFHFTIEQDTLQAIKDQAHYLFPSVAIERVWQEFQKMSQFSHFDIALIQLHRLRLLGQIFPDLKDAPVEEIRHRLLFLPDFPKGTPVIAKVLELFPSYSLQEKLELCEYLKLSNKDKNFVTFWHHAQKFLKMDPESAKNLQPYDWAKFYAHEHSDLCLKIMQAKIPKKRQNEFYAAHNSRKDLLQPFIWRIRHNKPAVTAKHLIAEGIQPGKKMGNLLKEAERLSVNHSIEDAKKVIELLKSSSYWQ